MVATSRPKGAKSRVGRPDGGGHKFTRRPGPKDGDRGPPRPNGKGWVATGLPTPGERGHPARGVVACPGRAQPPQSAGITLPALVRWLLALAVILLAGNSPGVGKRDVVFDGDSITVLATPAIHQLLDPRYHVEVLATDGIRIDQGLPPLVAALSFHPYAVVENPGTNDALQGGAPNDRASSWASSFESPEPRRVSS